MKTSNPRLCLAFYFTSLCWISHGFVHHEKHTVAVPGLKSTQSTIKLRSRLRYSQTYGGKGKNDGSFQLFLDKSECNDQVFELMDGEASAGDGAYLEESASGFTDGEVDDTEVTNEADGVFSSVLLLNCVAILWGTQHAVIKTLINDTTPASYSLLRFGLAALIASPYLPKLPSKEDGDKSFDAWRWGSELAIYQFLGLVVVCCEYSFICLKRHILIFTFQFRFTGSRARNDNSVSVRFSSLPQCQICSSLCLACFRKGNICCYVDICICRIYRYCFVGDRWQ